VAVVVSLCILPKTEVYENNLAFNVKEIKIANANVECAFIIFCNMLHQEVDNMNSAGTGCDPTFYITIFLGVN
jgi:hypothetical protein